MYRALIEAGITSISQLAAMDDTALAEYLAVASLQADVIVAGDDRIAAAAAGIVPVASYDDLTR